LVNGDLDIYKIQGISATDDNDIDTIMDREELASISICCINFFIFLCILVEGVNYLDQEKRIINECIQFGFIQDNDICRRSNLYHV